MVYFTFCGGARIYVPVASNLSSTACQCGLFEDFARFGPTRETLASVDRYENAAYLHQPSKLPIRHRLHLLQAGLRESPSRFNILFE